MLLLLLLLLSDAPSAETKRVLQVFRDEFVKITPGKGQFPASFLMGRDRGRDTERPRHRVRFDYAFAVAKYEVPQELWKAVMGKNPSRWLGTRNSVEELSFHEAQSFCRKVTKMLRTEDLITANQEVRLPTEAEWEYVARAGTDTQYSFGDELSLLDDHAWSSRNAAGNDPPVGAKKPNPWGLYDVHGYLWEWCADQAMPTYAKAPSDGSALQETGGKNRGVVRGGSWKNDADQLTSSFRRFVDRGLRDDAIGLRCILASVRRSKRDTPTSATDQ